MHRSLLACLLSFALPGAVLAADAVFYLGTFTSQRNAKSEGIYAGRIDTETGKLGPLILAAPAREPWFLAVSRDGKRVYSSLEVAPEVATVQREGAAGAYRKREDGTLEPLNEKSSGGAIACHLSLDPAGRHVLVANYTGASIACFQTKPDGSLGERTAFHQFSGTGPDPKRQKQSHPHSIYPSPDGRFAYVCDLGTDDIRVFKLDADRGTLDPAEPPAAKAPPGSGPRHLAFGGGGAFVYTGNEMGLSVSAFARDAATGALTLLQTLPTLPADAPTQGVTVAEVICHPSGKWLYVSNRGRDSLAVYAIAEDGMLSWVEDAPAHVAVPWGFDIDPTGRWLVVGGQKNNKIVVLKIDETTGKLTPTGQEAEVGAPVCVVFAPKH